MSYGTLAKAKKFIVFCILMLFCMNVGASFFKLLDIWIVGNQAAMKNCRPKFYSCYYMIHGLNN